MGVSLQFYVLFDINRLTKESILSDPLELFGIIIILVALIFVAILSRILLKSYKENKARPTLYFFLAFILLIIAAIFLFIEQFGYSSIGDPNIGDIGGVIATIAVGSSMVFVDLFSFHNTFPGKVKILGTIVGLVTAIYVGTIIWAILTGPPVKDVINSEIVYLETWINILIYCTVIPIIIVAPFTFYYYAYRVRDENKPNSRRSLWLGTGLAIFGAGYIAELAPFFPTILSIPFRVTYLIAAIILYNCFTLPEWFKKRIGWPT